MGEPRSLKQQREQLVRSLRASGASWVEVAAALQQTLPGQCTGGAALRPWLEPTPGR